MKDNLLNKWNNNNQTLIPKIKITGNIIYYKVKNCKQ